MRYQQEADQLLLFVSFLLPPSLSLSTHSIRWWSLLFAPSCAPHQVRRFAKAAGLKAAVLKCAQLFLPPKWGWACLRLLNASLLKWVTGEQEVLYPQQVGPSPASVLTLLLLEKWFRSALPCHQPAPNTIFKPCGQEPKVQCGRLNPLSEQLLRNNVFSYRHSVCITINLLVYVLVFLYRLQYTLTGLLQGTVFTSKQTQIENQPFKCLQLNAFCLDGVVKRIFFGLSWYISTVYIHSILSQWHSAKATVVRWLLQMKWLLDQTAV